MSCKEVLEKLFTLKAGDRRFDPFLGCFFFFVPFFCLCIFFLHAVARAPSLKNKTKKKDRAREEGQTFVCLLPSLGLVLVSSLS